MARQYFVFEDQCKKHHPRYRRCPSECAENGFDIKRIKKCDDCPLGQAEKRMERETLKLWKHTVGVKAEKYRFNKVLSQFYTIISAEETPKEKISVYSGTLLNIYLSERNLHYAKQDFKG